MGAAQFTLEQPDDGRNNADETKSSEKII